MYSLNFSVNISVFTLNFSVNISACVPTRPTVCGFPGHFRLKDGKAPAIHDTET